MPWSSPTRSAVDGSCRTAPPTVCRVTAHTCSGRRTRSTSCRWTRGGFSASLHLGSLFMPEPPHRFTRFGRPILAPASGTVHATHGGEPDHHAYRGLPSVKYALTQRRRLSDGTTGLAGNHVVIEVGPRVLVAPVSPAQRQHHRHARPSPHRGPARGPMRQLWQQHRTPPPHASPRGWTSRTPPGYPSCCATGCPATVRSSKCLDSSLCGMWERLSRRR
jgi:hypothetical protein